MKNGFLFFVFMLGTQVVSGQDAAKPFITRLYGTMGIDLLTSESSLMRDESKSMSLVAEFKGNYLLSIRSHSFDFEDGTFVPSRTMWYKDFPRHYVEEVNVSVKKFFQANRAFSFSFSTGLTLMQYNMPYNVKQYTGRNTLGSFYYYEFDTRQYTLMGWD